MLPIKRWISSPRLQSAVCLALIAGLTYLFLWRLWAAAPEDRAYLPEKSDLAEVFFPPRYYFARTLASGEFPLWNPHVYSGYPQFADPQAATFYPLALLFAGLAGSQFSMNTLALDIGLHFFLAGAFTFFFFRHVFKSNLPALLGALVFEFGGYLTYYPPLQLSELEAAPWLPLTLLLLTISVERRSGLLMAAAGVSLGQVFLAGRPQSYLTVGPITIAWFVYTAYHAGLARDQTAKMFLLLGGFALGTSAAQWIPTLQLTRLSTRSVLTYANVSEGGFPFGQFAGFLAPRLLGAQNLYVGLLALLLASLAVYQRKGLFWAGVCVVCLLGSVGKHLILFDALYLFERLGFPGYLRNVERLAFGITFSLAALAGYGIQLIQRVDRQLLRSVLLAMGGIFALTTLMIWLWSITRQPTDVMDPDLPFEELSFAAIMLLVGYLVFWILHDHPALARFVLAFIVVLDVMSVNHGRFLVQQSFAPGNDIERIAAAPPGRDAFYRVVFEQTSSQDFGSLLGVDNVLGMPPLMLSDYARLLGILDEYRRNILLNVEMVVTTGLYTDPSFELVAQQDDFKYYRFVVPKPRAYLAKFSIEVPSSARAAALLAAPDFDYWNTAVVIGNTGIDHSADLSSAESAAIVDRSANMLAVQATADQPRLLVVADAYYPGWQADIDGAPTPLYQTNVALRGVVVPQGTHTITMRFRPITFFVGVFASLLTCLAWLVWAGLSVALRKREPFSIRVAQG
jgi:hypothetical protein